MARDELLHPIVVGARQGGTELALDIGRDAELRRKQHLVVDAFLLVLGEARFHIPPPHLTARDLPAVPILVRVIDDRMVEMLADLRGPGLQIVLAGRRRPVRLHRLSARRH